MVDRDKEQTRRGGREDAEAENERVSRERAQGLPGQWDLNNNLSGSTTYETLPAQPAEGGSVQQGRSVDERLPDERSDRGSERAGERGSNPPHTTTGKITSPKFGAAGSGGLENEPGPERD